jgi:hypothetical protein
MRRLIGRSAVMIIALATAFGASACERATSGARTEAAVCALTRSDTLALAALARDTIARLKGQPQSVTLISAVKGGMAIRTEDADSTAFHNGGAVSFDCAKHVTSVWLDAG